MMNPNFKNRTLFHGDNLDFMRAINSDCVDLIATDPPFNKSRDFHATPDSLSDGASFQDRWSWENDVHQEWVDMLTDDHPALMRAIKSAIQAHSESMGAYMCFMAVRLLAMHRILKPTGSIYLHCDSTASHYLKAVMDAIFGQKNFLGEIVWNKKNGVKSRRRWGNEHENILSYAKRIGKHTFNIEDKDFRVPFSKLSLKMHFKKKDKNGRLYRERKHEGKSYIYYADEGRFIGNLWNDIPSMKANTPMQKESTGFPTQKPLALLDRIIKASTNEGDMVLDSFAGCATTCVAAERLNRQWIGIDIWEQVYDVVIDRLHYEVGIFGDVQHTTDLPLRTDDGDTAAPYLKVKQSIPEPPGRKMSRAEIYEILLSQQGTKCQGCDRKFDDTRYLELDHNIPRSDGGMNHITNRVLLCGPCNKLKSNIYTLSGLRRENKKRGYMQE